MYENMKSQYLKEIHEPKYDVLPKEEIHALILKAQAGCEESKNKIVNANVRLVPVIINKDVKAPSHLWMDCVSEGNICLMKSIEKFKPEKGASFATFAAQLIRWRLWKFVDDHRGSIRIPTNKLAKMRQAEKDETFGEGMIDLIDRTDIPVSNNFITPIIHGNEVPPRLDINGGLKNLLKEDKSILLQCLGILDEREMKIIKGRWLCYQEDKLTLEQMSQKLTCTRERVRQIEKRALGKLKTEINRQAQEEKNNQIRLERERTRDKVSA